MLSGGEELCVVETAVIFDLDGVLIDSEDGHLRSWAMLADELGYRISREEFLATFGRRNEEVIPELFGANHSVQEIRNWGERKETLYRETMRGRVPAVEGAVELVRACAADGMRRAVGSSGHPLNVAMALEELGIAGYIDVVVTGSDVDRGKPDPSVFLLAASRLGISPKRCVVVEDAPAGVEAALAGGMVAVGVATTHGRESLSRAAVVVDSPKELTPEILRSLVECR